MATSMHFQLTTNPLLTSSVETFFLGIRTTSLLHSAPPDVWHERDNDEAESVEEFCDTREPAVWIALGVGGTGAVGHLDFARGDGIFEYITPTAECADEPNNQSNNINSRVIGSPQTFSSVWDPAGAACGLGWVPTNSLHVPHLSPSFLPNPSNCPR